MPRRSGGGGGIRSSPGRSFGSAPRQPVSSVPARAPPAAPAAPPMQPAAVGQPRQPGLMAQMATTAAGVAIGSAVGHTLGAALTGGGGGHSEAAPAPQEQPVYNQPQNTQPQTPCQFELKQFMDCAQNQHDITLCQSFNEVLKDCRVRYGVPM